jgi:sialate O-acetylesterase
MANNNQTSTGIFNGMIAPLIPYAIKGVIWYQGESNAAEPGLYHIVFPALVPDWRSHWGQGDFPFLVVQLPNFSARKPQPGESNWAGTREAQALVLKQPNTGMAVTLDIGEPGNIHPADKLDVGHRLALVAQHVAYGDQGIVYTGPTYKSSTVEGNKIRIQFDNIGGGLTIGRAPDTYYAAEKLPVPQAPDAALQGFAIAAADHKYVWANASIDGTSVVVSSDAVPSPVTVRYAWADNPACNLYNKEGLPAAPFRTDDVPLPK